MVERWWAEAERNQVLPLDNRPFSELVFERPPAVRARARYRYWPGRAPVPESVAVNVRGRPHTITAHVAVDADLEVRRRACSPCRARCWGAGRSTCWPTAGLVYVHNLAGWRTYRVEAPVSADGRLAAGDHTLAMRFDPPTVDPPGRRLGRRDRRGAQRTIWSRFSLTGAGLTAGWSPDFSPADEDYRGAFAFTGTLHHVDIDVAGPAVIDADAEAQHAIATQ